MLKILLTAVLLSSQSLFAGTIKMSGGSEIVVSANDVTTVICESTSSNKVPCYCTSAGDGYYALRTKLNGIDTVISPATSYSYCLEYAKQNSFCM